MAYKIAVASTDGVLIDQSFGAAAVFLIFEVIGNTWQQIQKRQVVTSTKEASLNTESANCASTSCGPRGEGCGAKKQNGGCQGVLPGVEVIADCRAVLATHIGFNAIKQLEKKAIATFDVDCEVTEALGKIVEYFRRVDAHESLRGLRNNQAS